MIEVGPFKNNEEALSCYQQAAEIENIGEELNTMIPTLVDEDRYQNFSLEGFPQNNAPCMPKVTEVFRAFDEEEELQIDTEWLRGSQEIPKADNQKKLKKEVEKLKELKLKTIKER
ncbi:43805_t:CDS:2 [Gigaspora margarita]|uniref:43805_t:CDS:1 n=1 Tax=Gigaspora margarita TaxID=4874 RepID=A0ABM8W277_GIGMA|nr:43805_t:CDS:2 [Gigaspora margarita]